MISQKYDVVNKEYWFNRDGFSFLRSWTKREGTPHQRRIVGRLVRLYRRHGLIVTIFIVLIVGHPAAQTLTQTLHWVQSTDTLANIQNYVFTLVVTPSGGPAGTPVVLTATCVTAPVPLTVGASCSAPLTSLAPAGASLVLTATATQSATETTAGSTSSLPYVFLPPSTPGVPGSLSVTITVSVP
jgi:hypothetical protein